VAVEPPKKRRGWPKGQKRGPRKAKAEAMYGKAVVKKWATAGQKKSASLPNGAEQPKTLTQLMFNVDRATALVLEDMVAAIQGLPEDCRRDLIAALQRVFDEH
jgi:hypothetical protein